MGKSTKRSREVVESESNSEFENDEILNEMSDDAENFDDDSNDNNDSSDNDDDDDVDHFDNEDESGEQEEEEDEEGDQEEEDEDEEGDQGEEEEEGEEEREKLMEAHKIAEMEELEKEIMELRHKEQDLLKNLTRHKDEDILKGQAVKNQKALWDKTLELRFLLQKAFSNSNRLPQEPIRSSFCDSEDTVKDAYTDLLASSTKTLNSILELQEVLLQKNPSITQSADVNSAKRSKLLEDSVKSNGEVDEDWQKISQMHSRMAAFRDKSIDKWQRKTQVTSGAAAIKGKLQAFNQDISQQVAGYMRDPSKMIKGMQQSRSAVALFGTVPDASGNGEGTNMDGDPELLDDSEFYQHLLKEFFEAIDPASSETAFYALKRLQTKKRKIVDRRASKSRKIRYNIHEKIVNFMAPHQPVNLPPMASKLFENLFSGGSTPRPLVGSQN
ncbi:uncharacterized protein LOC132645778 [Lycium barbarum]|uniref:uncharacterized protein LOC132645778 n=1 Tax=Lycium barbarum TaxID=112863 RepID=UPI00293F1FA7|nr:uncharacterized protein LOC132645778 [Lycium barbarum]XP_060218959.1 uncharacterized protein LOC132645778 [Lycium barbarum]